MSKKSLSTTLDSDKFVLRLPDGMRPQIQALAKSRGRSMNAEIVAALSEWTANTESHDAMAAQIDRIERMIFEMNQIQADHVRLLQEKGRLPIPKVPKTVEARAFADFQDAVDATAKALQKRKTKSPPT